MPSGTVAEVERTRAQQGEEKTSAGTNVGGMMDDMTPEEFLPAATHARLERIRAIARTVLRDDYKARDFLIRPNALLGQRRPMELILEGEEGTRRVELILKRNAPVKP